jgi:DNA-binding NarL/FixJ family response regulator
LSTESTVQIHILVVDDHPVVRDGLVAILNTQPDFQVVGEAADGEQAIELASRLDPDVVLLDLEMPVRDGEQAIPALYERSPRAQVIVFTAFDTDERILGAVKAGAKGYLLKGAPREEIFNAVRVVSRGGSLLQPVVASRLIEQLRSAGQAPGPEASLHQTLTGREREVLVLLGQGKTNKEIAALLVITERTVKFHVSALLRKLGAGNRTEAVTTAAQRGLIEI